MSAGDKVSVRVRWRDVAAPMLTSGAEELDLFL